jgi:transposase-like protein
MVDERMPTIQDEQPKVEGEIVEETCPQCGYGESVRSAARAAEGRPRFRTCPRCGYGESEEDGQTRRWKGYGVFVLEAGRGVVKAGTFPRAIPDHKVTRLVARFRELGPSVRYVTRWNEQESRVEVLMGLEKGQPGSHAGRPAGSE